MGIGVRVGVGVRMVAVGAGVAVGVGVGVAVEVGMVVAADAECGRRGGGGNGGGGCRSRDGVAVVERCEQPIATGRTKAMAITIRVASFGAFPTMLRVHALALPRNPSYEAYEAAPIFVR